VANRRERDEGRFVGITDRLKDLRKKAGDTSAEHKDQIQAAVEKAEVAADERTGGKYHDQIAKAGAKVEEYVENLKPEASNAEDAPATARQASAPPPDRSTDAP
jgi:hypothetical protein